MSKILPVGTELIDAIEDFEGGVNQTRNPLKLAKNVMAHAVNTTVRDSFPTHRPPYFKRLITYENATTQALVEGGLFQGACEYSPDNSATCLMAAISGNLFKFQIVLNVITCTKVSSGVLTQNPANPQHWLWQSEKWVIWQDGSSAPIFYDNAVCVRSNWSQAGAFATTLTAAFDVPAVNATVVGAFTSVANLQINDIVQLQNIGSFKVAAIAMLNVTLVNLTAAIGNTGANLALSWSHSSGGTQLPPGRIGVYGMGRVWVQLTDGKQFLAGDLVGGSSGTAANNRRDAVLNITENTFLVGGGTFTVPGNVGEIKAMRFIAILDKSLGQGPLQVLTSTTVFSCDAPVDRLTWQSLTNPILTESLISNGGKSQNSTILSNGDLLFRAIDGERSLIMARKDFNTWGTTPISNEVDDILRLDDPGLLVYASSVVFDNRMLLTTHPISHAQGVYWLGLVPINLDPVSSLRGKAPSVYDSGIWTGLNILQLTIGNFNDVQRAFAFVLNTSTGATKIELWELGKTNSGIADHDGVRDIPIRWKFRSPSLKFGMDDPRARQLMRLSDGEIGIKDLRGTVTFEARYYPDQWPCPVPWFSWQECQLTGSPGFRPRMGLGEPSGQPCDTDNDRPLRECYTMQFELVIEGHCVFLDGRFKSVVAAERRFAKQSCNPICP